MNRKSEINPLISVFTCACNSKRVIERPYNSLKRQHYLDWEWVIYDDSDDGETSSILNEMARNDFRIRVIRGVARTGNVGYNKKLACGNSFGEILVELDHDDELTPNALADIAKAFNDHPDAGFVYTDFAECHEDKSPVWYGKNLDAKPPKSDWAFGYGSYRREVFDGVEYLVANTPNINPKTIRYITSAPNHARCWRKSFYDRIGGHSPLMHVVDDYELMVRTFVLGKMVHLPKFCYIQYRNAVGNTHKSRNAEIQRLSKAVSANLDEQIHQRFLALGVDDYVYRQGRPWVFNTDEFASPDVEQYVNAIWEPKTPVALDISVKDATLVDGGEQSEPPATQKEEND
jgi:glycosyltransferase involved in cell wall biosynthesis